MSSTLTVVGELYNGKRHEYYGCHLLLQAGELYNGKRHEYYGCHLLLQAGELYNEKSTWIWWMSSTFTDKGYLP